MPDDALGELVLVASGTSVEMYVLEYVLEIYVRFDVMPPGLDVPSLVMSPAF